APKSSLATANPEALRRLDLPENMDHYLAIHPSSSLRVMAGALKPEEGELVTAETVGIALQQLRRHFAYLVIDTSSQFTDPVLAALEASDKIFVLCSPEMSLLRDIRECQRICDSVLHIQRDRVHYVMNNIFPFKTLSRGQLEEALQRKLFAELPYGGDAAAKTALKGETLVETRSGSPLARGIQALASQVTNEGKKSEGNQDRKRSFFR
ncbi:MAG: AAA family ATPase, partial [Chloroflexota bacterium]